MRVANTRCQHVRVMAVRKYPKLVWLVGNRVEVDIRKSVR